jgi:hypothetical protein
VNVYRIAYFSIEMTREWNKRKVTKSLHYMILSCGGPLAEQSHCKSQCISVHVWTKTDCKSNFRTFMFTELIRPSWFDSSYDNDFWRSTPSVFQATSWHGLLHTIPHSAWVLSLYFIGTRIFLLFITWCVL